MTALLLVDRASGRTFAHFLIDSPDEEVVSVVGSFNDWVPGVHVLAPQGDGNRVVLVEVHHPGDVHFRYLASGGRWFDDPSAHVVNEYGSTLHRHAAQETDVAGPAEDGTPAKKAPAKKAAAKKAAATKKAATKKAAAKKAATKKAATKNAATKNAATKAPAKKTVAAKKAAQKPATKVAVKEATAKKASAKKAAKKSG